MSRSRTRGYLSPDLWDPVVRITQWGVALAVILNATLTRGGGSTHVWIGWGAMALLVLRILWGLVGTAEARFSAFPPNPVAALRHLARLVAGRPGDYASHNPAGAMMAYTLWAALSVMIVTGLMLSRTTPWTLAAQEAAVAAGDWSVMLANGTGGEDAARTGPFGISRSALAGVHRTMANVILLLAALHVGGVIVESRAMRRNLVRPMIAGPGRARRRDEDAVRIRVSSR
jgi:cytochrome b